MTLYGGSGEHFLQGFEMIFLGRGWLMPELNNNNLNLEQKESERGKP